MKKKKNIHINKDVLSLSTLSTPEGRRGNITLDLNEGYGTLPKRILKKISSIDFSISRYPEYQGLTKHIARDLRVSPENIFLTNGSDDAIRMLIDIFFKKGDRVTLPVPTFFIYNHFLALRSVSISEVPYLFKKEQFIFPLSGVLENIRKGTRGVMISNPGNPIGVAISKSHLLKIAKETHRRGIPFVVDEAYFEYCGVTLVPLIKRFPNIVILRTFSKAYGLAGLRVGYVVGDMRVISALNKLRLPWSINSIAVEVAKIVLAEKREILSQVKIQKKILGDIARSLEKKNLPVYPTTTNFLLVRVKDASKAVSSLKKEKLLIKDLSQYPAHHGLLHNLLRITVPARQDYKKTKELLRKKL